jgi:hypothetical protein
MPHGDFDASGALRRHFAEPDRILIAAQQIHVYRTPIVAPDIHRDGHPPDTGATDGSASE